MVLSIEHLFECWRITCTAVTILLPNLHCMKKALPIFGLLLCAAAALFFFNNSTKKPVSLVIPGGEGQEENRELREEWEHMRLADPATGQIPKGISLLERLFAQQLPQAVSERSGPEWASRGPWNVGGRTRALAIDATNENRILAGGVSGGIWLSEDGGQTWSKRTPLNAHQSCVSIAQDTRLGHTDTWYYLSGELYGNSAGATGAYYLGDGAFKSTDGGLTWAPLGATDNGAPETFSDSWQGCWRIATNPAVAEDEVYAAVYGTIYKSVNGGTSWSVSLNAGNAYATDVAVTHTGAVYATVSSDDVKGGFWRLTNGSPWVRISPDTSAGFPTVFDRFVIGINPDNENEVYFLGTTPGSGHFNNYLGTEDWTSLWKYTYLSGDGSGAGGQWQDLSENLPAMGTEFDRFAAQGGYDLVVKVQPGTGHVFIGGTNIYRSTDGFSSPNNTTHIGGYKPGTYLPFFEIYPNHHPDQHDMLFLPSNPNILISASDGGVHRTDDANAGTVVWTPLNNGYRTTQCYTLIINKETAEDNTIISGLQDNGNFFVNSDSPVAPWRQTVNGDGSYGAIAPDKSFYILSIQRGRVAKVAMDDQGNISAFRRIDPIGPKSDDYLFINPLALDPNDQNVLYLPVGRKLYRQDNLGSIALTGAWDTISQGWTIFPDTLVASTSGADNVFSAIAVSKANPAHRVYVGSSRRNLYRIDNAHTGNPNWVALTNPSVLSTSYITSIAVDPENADHILVAFSNYGVYSLFYSTDAGQSWIKVGGNLESAVNGSGSGPSVRSVSILPLPDGTRKYFFGTSIGLYSADTLLLHSSSQAGTQWVLESPDLIGRVVVEAVETRPSDGLVLAGTHANGVYSKNVLPVSGSNEPWKGIQAQVWPNPVVSAATIQINGVTANGAICRVFNLQGKLVKEITFRQESEQLDMQGFAAGVYLYSIEGKGWKRSGKIVKS